MTTILGTKFSMFCSPHPNGILIRLARFGMLGPSILPRNTNKLKSYSKGRQTKANSLHVANKKINSGI
jgi:hypothetical protein